MLYIDQKYLLLIAPVLERFSQKSENLYNCRCPICGDSTKNKLKARGYFYESEEGLYYKCHNCSYSSSFKVFLERVDNTLYSQYALERLNNNQRHFTSFKKDKKEIESKRVDLVSAFDSQDEVTAYARSRGFSDEQLKRIYSCDNFRKWAVTKFTDKYAKVSESKKLVLPFFDLNGNLVGAQARSIDPSDKLRYETVKHPDADHVIFGLDKWNRNKTTKIVEGPIDSLFIQNALAIASSDLKRVKKILSSLDIQNTIFCWDNEPRSKEIVKLIEEAINQNFKVFLWPQNISCKDFNDAAQLKIDIESIISNNTFQGMQAKLKFTTWRKV